MDLLTILLVEDDFAACKKFNDYINTIEDVRLIDFTNNANQALLHITNSKPDVIILDLELHNGVGSGLDVLAGLTTEMHKPFIVVTTNNSSQIIYDHARILGADIIMPKHQKDYSEKYVIDLLVSMKNVIKKATPRIETVQPLSSEIQLKHIMLKISTELDLIGIDRRSVGFKYLVDGIYMSLDGAIPKLCDKIAEKYNKSEPSVERAMQNAINKAWKTTDIDTLLKHYTAYISADRSAPTLTQFISYYADKIKFIR